MPIYIYKENLIVKRSNLTENRGGWKKLSIDYELNTISPFHMQWIIWGGFFDIAREIYLLQLINYQHIQVNLNTGGTHKGSFICFRKNMVLNKSGLRISYQIKDWFPILNLLINPHLKENYFCRSIKDAYPLPFRFQVTESSPGEPKGVF